VSINNFKPTIWSALILRAQKKNLIFGQAGVVNRDYQGDIADYGSSVVINSIGDPSIFTYTPNVSIPAPQVLAGVQRTMTINQAQAFNFEVDDVDDRQASIDVVPEALDRAGYRLSDIADQYIAAQIVASASASPQPAVQVGTVAAPLNIDNATKFAYNALVQAKIAMNESNVPLAGRWAIVPAWFEGALGLDTRFIGTRGLDQNNVLLTGAIGQAAGFNIMTSNNVPIVPGTTPVYQCICGVSSAVSYAEQLNKVEAYRPPSAFADALKGLHLYGAAVIRPYQLAILNVTDGLGLAGAGVSDPAA